MLNNTNREIQKCIDYATTRRRSARINIDTLEPEFIEPPVYYEDFDKVKFAFLIIEKCINVVEQSEGDMDFVIFKLRKMFDDETNF